MERAVVFSTNSNPFYSFYLPITAWVWKNRIGLDPVVLVTDDVDEYIVEKTEVWLLGAVLL